MRPGQIKKDGRNDFGPRKESLRLGRGLFGLLLGSGACKTYFWLCCGWLGPPVLLRSLLVPLDAFLSD